MKIAGITDIHDSMVNLERLTKDINSRRDIDVVINCGDLLSSKVIEKLAELNKQQYIVFSGPDQRDDSTAQACLNTGITCFYEYGDISLGGKKIGFTHVNNPSNMMKGYDVVFYGHLHEYRVEEINGCLFICCGEVMGRRISPCYVVYDTVSGEVEKVEI